MFLLLTVSVLASPIYANEAPETVADSLQVLESIADVAEMKLEQAIENFERVKRIIPATATKQAEHIEQLRSARKGVAEARALFARAKASYCDHLVASITDNDREKVAARRSAWRHRQTAARYQRRAYALSTPSGPTLTPDR